MGAILALGAVVTVAALFAGVVALVFVAVRRHAEALRNAWAGAAREHGLTYDGREIVGRKERVAVRVCTITRGSGKNKRTYTVAAARLDVPLDLGLNLRAHGFFNDLFHHSQDVSIGDPAFDARFIVSADEAHRAQALFVPELRRILIQSFGGSCSLNDYGFTVECNGATTDARWLSWAIGVSARITSLMDEGRRNVPVASALRAHRAAWAAFAKAHDLRGSETPLAMWGRIDGAQVQAYAVRAGAGLYELEVSVRFREALGIGLSVQPMGLMDKLSVFLGGDDLRVGHHAFDDAFRVRASHEQACRTLLSQEMCNEVLSLQTHLGPVSLDDRGLAVRLLSSVPRDPSIVPRTVHHLTVIIEHIRIRAREATRGAYR